MITWNEIHSFTYPNNNM